MRLHLDFETRSPLELKKFGLDRYAKSAEVLLMAYTFGDDPVYLWSYDEPAYCFPDHVRDALVDPLVTKYAWNASFERAILRHVWRIDSPIEQWIDPSVIARYAGLPSKLALVSEFLMLGDKAKDKAGKKLINWFSKTDRKGNFRDPKDPKNAEKWAQFKEYCRQDVVAEREIFKRIGTFFELPPTEKKLWFLDSKINERGMPVSMEYTRKSIEAVGIHQDKLKADLKTLTGLENPNSTQQLLPWLRERGYPFKSLGKAFVAKAMAQLQADPERPRGIRSEGEVLGALTLRQQASRSNVKKLDAIINKASDDVFRYAYKFYGAHTGRWSGELQTLAREASMWGDVEVNVRSAFQAPDGKKLVVADLASIETRVLAWLAQCQPLLDVFAAGKDPYKDLASYMYGVHYGDVTKAQRQIAKSAVLGCGYQLSAGDWRMTCCGKLRDKKENTPATEVCSCKKKKDEFKAGLWGYAANMGIDMPQEQCKEAVSAYRSKYCEVPVLWTDLEIAAIAAMESGYDQQTHGIRFSVIPGKLLSLTLPSGRKLHYPSPMLEEPRFEWAKRKAISYLTHEGKGWIRSQLYGGLFTENIVQAIARDVLGEGMLRADATGSNIVGHTHDELILLEDESVPAALPVLISNMTSPMPWAPDLPLAAEGAELKIYTK